MLVCRADDAYEALTVPITFAEWIEHGHELGWPTLEDLEYHATTLFPPVRPRGWLELRMIDALPAPWWRVATAVAAVLVQDPELDDVVREVASTRDRWTAAARHGLGDPALAHAACTCFTAALDAMPRAGADAVTVAATDEYIRRYVAPGRCPADDVLEEWQAGGRALPRPDNVRAWV